MRVENLLPDVVDRRVPARPEWVAANQRDPQTAAEVYGKFALAFSTLFFGLFAVGVWNPALVLFVPLVAGNAAAWAWALWRAWIPADGPVSRRRAIRTGFAVGTLSWLSVGPLLAAASVGYSLLAGTGFQTADPLGAVLGLGAVYSIAGFGLTFGIPTAASVGLALWTLDYEERSGREKRESNYQFQ